MITGVYRPPLANDTFYDQLTDPDILKENNPNNEFILMGDFNLNLEDKMK